VVVDWQMAINNCENSQRLKFKRPLNPNLEPGGAKLGAGSAQKQCAHFTLLRPNLQFRARIATICCQSHLLSKPILLIFTKIG
jgi:hypothetical protein